MSRRRLPSAVQGWSGYGITISTPICTALFACPMPCAVLKVLPRCVRERTFMYYDTAETGKRIQDLRKSKGLTQEQLAEQLNISTVHLAKIEIGSRSCSLDILIAIAIFFDASLDYIVFGKAHSDNDLLKAELSSLIGRMTALEQML